MKRTTTGIAALGGTLTMIAAGVLTAAPSSAHGYVNGPESRAYLCKVGVNTDCGGVQYEPQSLEYLKGFPQAGPADGQIASAGGQFGGLLDEQSADRWAKTDIVTGPMLVDWTYTAPHSTSKWHYYMTKQGWDPNSPLTRADLELITEVQHDGSKASTNPDHVIDVPADRSGYHVILAVWDVADTVNAFYDVIDVNVIGQGDVDVTAPMIPSGLTVESVSSASIGLSWDAVEDDREGAVTYVVYRDGERIASTGSTSFTNDGLVADSAYLYQVTAVDRAGNASAPSSGLVARTAVAPVDDITAPSTPQYLHSMGQALDSVRLMWNASTDDVGVVEYHVYRDGALVGTTGMTMLTDTGLQAGTDYSYAVSAVDAAGNESARSAVLTVTTEVAPAPEPDPTPSPAPTPTPSGTWDPYGSYAAGAQVTYDGVTYEAVQGHTGAGDPNWIHALSLWRPVVEEPAPAPEAAVATWSSTGSYSAGDRVSYQGATYEAVQSHTGNGDPNWIHALSLWKPVG